MGLGFDEIFLNYTRFYTKMLMGRLMMLGPSKLMKLLPAAMIRLFSVSNI